MADAPKPGRPPVDRSDPDPSVGVYLRLPARQYDRTYDRAQQAGCSVPEMLRRDLQRADDSDDRD